MVSQLKTLGYETFALSAVSQHCWSIGRAYQMLGFDRTVYEHNFTHPRADEIFYRISDKTIFERIVDEVKQKRKKPLFIWATTLQNHGGYARKFEDGIKLESPRDKEAEHYLNMLHRSDTEFKKLLQPLRNSLCHFAVPDTARRRSWKFC